MLSQNLSGYVDASARSGADPHGSHGPAVQAPRSHPGDGLPTFAPLLQTSGAAVQEGPTLLTSKRPVIEQEKKGDEEPEESSASEEGGPPDDCVYFGVDLKPILPAALAISTVLGWVYILLFQVPLLSQFTSLSQATVAIPVSVLHVIVLACWLYCTYADPGQLNRSPDIEAGLPLRSHQSWLYPHPIRRYDHYCKYVKNAIALNNHRPFVIMIAGLVVIALTGVVLDLWLASLIAVKGPWRWRF